MNTLYIIYGIVGLISLISVTVAFLNWIFIASTSTRISNVEKEVRKKSTEFDSLRKEVQQARKGFHTNEDINVAPAHAQVSGIHGDNHNDSEDIQIVRNVRSAFSPSEVVMKDEQVHPHDHPPSPVNPDPQIDTVMPPTSQAPTGHQFQAPSPDSHFIQEPSRAHQPESPQAEFPSPGDSSNHADFTGQADQAYNRPEMRGEMPSEMIEPPMEAENDVLDIVDENRQNEPDEGIPDRIMITIPLFSTSKKDADFSRAWKILSEKLPHIENPVLKLDFENILFLYEKEINYLEQIVKTVQMHHGDAILSNCQQELKYILRNNPTLASCIEN
ncbi:MAG: hypothetical protein GF401_17400 [Chitinivibrionales bacterium]|nr:hypothetical protein [Chitinivibrionales bacterium]